MRTVSILIPTLNAGRVLDACLASIAAQDYDRAAVEIIVADGGSTDDTVAIARRYGARICANPLKTGEAGKAAALKQATGEIVASIDSDNILPRTDWLTHMVAPFDDPEIAGAEPVEYTWRRQDGYITRYGALMGMIDPLCLFLGNYDRYCTLTRRWTGMPVQVEERERYFKVTLDRAHLPTIGANGFLVRRTALARYLDQDYIFDIDVLYDLLQQGPCRIAKVKIGIVHLFSGDARTYVRKQMRRVNDYFYYARQNQRRYPWQSTPRGGLVKFILYTATVVPVVVQAAIGWSRKPDSAWLFHPVACVSTLVVYAYGTVRSRFVAAPHDRTDWSQ